VAHAGPHAGTLTQDKVRLVNQLEALLEDAHLKLSKLCQRHHSQSARRMLQAIAEGLPTRPR